jgi:hypothetical protein
MQLSVLALTALLAGPAQAATQILGLVASNGLPTPLHCAAGTGRAIVNAFCLQSERPAPAVDDAYQLAPGSGLTIIARRADSSAIRVSGEGLLTIRPHAGFTLVAISLPEQRLKALCAPRWGRIEKPGIGVEIDQDKLALYDAAYREFAPYAGKLQGDQRLERLHSNW